MFLSYYINHDTISTINHDIDIKFCLFMHSNIPMKGLNNDTRL